MTHDRITITRAWQRGGRAALAFLAALTAALAAALAAAPLPAQEPPPKCRDCEAAAGTEEVWARYLAEIARLRTQVELLRREREGLVWSATPAADSARRSIDAHLTRLARALVTLEASVERDAGRRTITPAQARRFLEQTDSLQRRATLRMVHVERQPAGYMGVALRERVEPTGQVWTKHYIEYPVVQSVEPASPAQRAGLRVGDTIVAYNGDDVRRQPVMLGKLLRPGATVDVSVRRNGATVTIPVQIISRALARGRAYAVTPRPGERTIVEVEPGYVYTPAAPVPPAARGAGGITPQPAPLPPPTEFQIRLAGSNLVIAGAEVVRVSEGLREYFGVERGVLVLNVAAGTPAARAGLKGGDVIVRVDGARLGAPQDFQRAVQRASERRSAGVELVRKRKQQSVRLSW